MFAYAAFCNNQSVSYIDVCLCCILQQSICILHIIKECILVTRQLFFLLDVVSVFHFLCVHKKEYHTGDIVTGSVVWQQKLRFLCDTTELSLVSFKSQTNCFEVSNTRRK